ncbi:hypothetical protein QBC46DRAFT_377253 [Diplogelasinospora grovesii]|uniref:Secreted protein n=1 Tax=Diplogelasinospora grovesii TaxID=303347 RepID=A0AAN6NGY2_9PEZI|nr:hypothetical protein QBC46DRAFT_377253 [Diplogelasinospora grovesii]
MYGMAVVCNLPLLLLLHRIFLLEQIRSDQIPSSGSIPPPPLANTTHKTRRLHPSQYIHHHSQLNHDDLVQGP